MNLLAAYRLPAFDAGVAAWPWVPAPSVPTISARRCPPRRSSSRLKAGARPSPADALARGSWWQLYGDAELNALVERLNVSNQNLAASEAQYRQARALWCAVRGRRFIRPCPAAPARPRAAARAAATAPSCTADGISASGSIAASSLEELRPQPECRLGAGRIWGKLRRSLESSRAGFEASAADLAALQLSLQAELVQTYLQLRVLDDQQRLLDATVAAYARSLKLTQNQYNAGIVPKSDVSQALTQLKSTQAQAIDLTWQRAQLEHALAVLVGVPPSELSIAVREPAAEHCLMMPVARALATAGAPSRMWRPPNAG